MQDHPCARPTNDPGVRRVFDRIMDLTDSQRDELFDLLHMHQEGLVTEDRLDEYGETTPAGHPEEMAIFIERIQLP